MFRMALGLGVVAVLLAVAGCTMCCHPYDYCGPVYDDCGYHSCSPCSRAGSVLSGVARRRYASGSGSAPGRQAQRLRCDVRRCTRIESASVKPRDIRSRPRRHRRSATERSSMHGGIARIELIAETPLLLPL